MISVLGPPNLRTNSYMNPNVIIVAILTLVVLAIYRSYRRPRTTKLRGPPSKSFLFGVTKDLFNSCDLSGIYRNWERTYGPVYEMPSSLGSTILVLQDPKAITDLFSKDTTTYHQSRFSKALFKNVFMVSLFGGSCEAILSRSSDGRLTVYFWLWKETRIRGRLSTWRYIFFLSWILMFFGATDNGELSRLLSQIHPQRILPPFF